MSITLHYYSLTLSYGYMPISEAVTLVTGKELLGNRSLSTKLMEKFDQLNTTELSRAKGFFRCHRSLKQDAKDFAWPVSGFSQYLYQIPTTMCW